MKATLQDSIISLNDKPSGATNVAAGMKQAENLMGDGYNYDGNNNNRQKVVIVFTDGVPTTSSDFSTEVATSAIASAKNLKDAGTTVYTVGIFSGVDPNQLYGEKFDYFNIWGIKDVPCNGNVGDIWGISSAQSFVAAFTNDFNDYDVPAGNRFLNFLSSNFADADEIGIVFGNDYNPGGHTPGSGYKITKNFTRSNSDYYLTANDSASLNSIFQSISENIQTGSASVQLGTETVVQDVISDYFELPAGANASNIKVSTALYDQNGEFGADMASNLSATINGKTITVTGFDFSQNYCDKTTGRTDGDNNQQGNFYGRKLIIEIPIVVREGFLGGDGVPTNTSDSKIIAANGTVMEQFEIPKANVPVSTPVVTAVDKNVYLMHTMTEDEMKADAKITANGTDLLGELDWQDDYVDISTTYTSSSDPMVADDTYTVNCTITSSSDSKSSSDEANIIVFKPEITFRDSQINLGDTPAYETENHVSTVWKHEGKSSTDVTMTGTEPPLSYAYDPSAAAFQQDTHVNVTVTIGEKDINFYVSFLHVNCDFNGCGWDAESGEFMVHIKTFNLTIVKEGVNVEKDGNAPFVFNVTGQDLNMDVVIYGNDSITIKGLPVGTYTVSEASGYWRYTCSTEPQTVNAGSVSNGSATVTFENERTEDKWLDDFASATNVFKDGSISAVKQ